MIFNSESIETCNRNNALDFLVLHVVPAFAILAAVQNSCGRARRLYFAFKVVVCV